MLLKTQFIKCTLCVILYTAICFFLLKIKENVYLIQQPGAIVSVNSNQTEQTYLLESKEITKPVNLEIKHFEHSGMNRQLINLQVSLMFSHTIDSMYVMLITLFYNKRAQRYFNKLPMCV